MLKEVTPLGRILAGEERRIRESRARWADQPVDLELPDSGEPFSDEETTLADEVVVSGPGTFLGGAQRTLRLLPSRDRGWAFQRVDLPYVLPIPVSVHSVWTTVRNIVLCSGSPHNYMRMVEHIIAVRIGWGLDNVLVRVETGDPPLFDRSTLEIVEAIEQKGCVGLGRPATWVTVKEPVTVGGRNGSFLTFLPAERGQRRLWLDCGLDFRSAIGRQRIRFAVSRDTFRQGAVARTNTSLLTVLYCKTLGRIFADIRHLGYTRRNILIAGRWRYLNRPRLIHEPTKKALEPAWHRAALDLLAALALIERGRFVGTVISFKAGHTLDVRMIRELYRHDLLEAI